MSITTDPGVVPSAVTPDDRPAIQITDGGLETTLVFHQGIDLEDFAAFPLLRSEDGRSALAGYYAPYVELAERLGVGMVLDTPTWRASSDWGARQGFGTDDMAAVNREAVEFVRGIAEESALDEVVINGAIGPRGDGYEVGTMMTVDEAASYHGPQIRAFRDAGVDSVTAVTMTYVDEAIGIARAAAAADVPVVIGFTTETDGRLPSGQALADAIAQVDAETGGVATFFMVNCAHPSHFSAVLDGSAEWCRRIGAIRANASRASHEELDAAPELDRGDPAELANDYVELRRSLPSLHLVGGCCGTDHEHVAAIGEALIG